MNYPQGAREVKLTPVSIPGGGNESSSAARRASFLSFNTTECRVGEVLFEQAAAPREAFILDRGLVKLTRLGQDGQEMIVGLRSQGAILGAASMIVQGAHQMTATTLTPCSVRRLPLKRFLDLVRTDLELSWDLIEAHSREVWDQAEQLADLKHLSARQRFERLLRQLISLLRVNLSSKTVSLPLPLKFCEIAQLIGVTPEHLSRVLKQAEAEGLVQRDNRCLIISDYRSLFHPL
ncbi:MAG: Crp/Fnr family transcriptional regulator [Blastocatellia bacterium]